MPTYRNDTKFACKVMDLNDEERVIGPSESIQTYWMLTLSGMTKTAEAPYFNPSDGVHEISSTGLGDDKTINLNSNTDEIELWNESGADITCFLRATVNTPGMKILANSIRNISGLSGMAEQIILQFTAAVSSGQCYLTELRG